MKTPTKVRIIVRELVTYVHEIELPDGMDATDYDTTADYLADYWAEHGDPALDYAYSDDRTVTFKVLGSK